MPVAAGPIAADPSAADHSFVDGLGAFIHATVPHSSAALDAISIATVVSVGLVAVLRQWWTGRRWPADQFVRVGFAAAPLPVYVFLPCLPFDKDLAVMFEDERVLIALAAASGFMWTVREIRMLFREDREAAAEEP